MPTRVGFIGLGEMGKGMAKNIARKGFALTVFDIREEPVNELVEMGAHKARSPKELAAASEVVLSMVRDDAQTQEAMWGKEGVLKGIDSGSAIIITSTVSPSLCQRLAREVAKKGVGVLDSPVNGGRVGAEEGTLTLMIGGDKTLYKKMEPVLAAFSANRYHLGEIGMGEVAKLANNMIFFSCMAGTTEALAFATKAGISAKTFLAFVNVSTGSNWVSQRWDYLAALRKDQSPAAALHMMYRDLNLGLSYAKELGVDTPMCSELDKVDLWRHVE